jgi:hypothetical protein
MPEPIAWPSAHTETGVFGKCDSVMVETGALLVDGAADAIGAGAKSLDEATGYPIYNASHHEIHQILDTALRQYGDIFDHSQCLQTPPRLDLVLDVVQQTRRLAVAARQQDHLVGLGRLVDVDEALQSDIEVEPSQIAVVVVHLLGVEEEFVKATTRLLHEDAALAGLDGGQPLGALVRAVPDHDLGGSHRLVEVR